MESKAGLPFSIQITFLLPETNESNVRPDHAFAGKKRPADGEVLI